MFIIKATYGDQDVTEVVKKYIKNDKLYIKASNDVFGDLNPGVVKTLVVKSDKGEFSVKEGGYIKLPKSSIKKLGIFYTNNNIDKVVKESLNNLVKFNNVADILTCSWYPIEGNPFFEISAMTRSSNHLNIVIQILQLLYSAKESGQYEYVSFLEHDVLYPDGYFDFPDFNYGEVLTNMNYKGICPNGWQIKNANHEPLHQMTMRFDYAIHHFEKMLNLAIAQGGVLVEPQDAKRIQWNCINPAVHINHGKNFTSHYSIYSKETHLIDDYWGKFENWINKIF
jgi:hypothetical protein